MRKIGWIIFCVLICSSMVFSQSITVTNPDENAVWYKGQ